MSSFAAVVRHLAPEVLLRILDDFHANLEIKWYIVKANSAPIGYVYNHFYSGFWTPLCSFVLQDD